MPSELPFVMSSIATARLGFRESRSTPPIDPAAASVWQPVQPTLVKVWRPAFTSPSELEPVPTGVPPDVGVVPPPEGVVEVGLVGVGGEPGRAVVAFTTSTPLAPARALPATESRYSKRPLASVTAGKADFPGPSTGVPLPGQESAVPPVELEQITKRCGFLPAFSTLKTTLPAGTVFGVSRSESSAGFPATTVTVVPVADSA